MGDRVSIQFKDPDGKLSPALFNHGGGMEFVRIAKAYALELIAERNTAERYPLDRLEAATVMVDFIRFLVAKEPAKRVEHNLYIEATLGDGDNSDNGNHVIRLRKKRP